MLEKYPTLSRVQFESALADFGERFTYESQRTNARVSVANPSLVAGYHLHLDGIFESIEIPSEHAILGSIESMKLQRCGEKLRELITQYFVDMCEAQLPQPMNQSFPASYDRVRRDALIPTSAVYAIMEPTIQASNLLKLRQDNFDDLQLRLIQSSWYQQACRDLSEVSIEALEEGFEAPEPSTIEYARIILERLSEEYDQFPDIEPMSDRSIAICFENRERDSRILIVVESDRAGLLIARIDGSSYRQRVSDVLKVLQFGGYHAMDEAGIRKKQRNLADH